jgi:hypothetical protein
MYTTTLNRLKYADFYPIGLSVLLQHLDKKEPDNEPLPLVTILDALGLADAVWALRTVPEYGRESRGFAIDCFCQCTNPDKLSKELCHAADTALRFHREIVNIIELQAAFEKALAAAPKTGKGYYLAHVAHPDAAVAAYHVHVADYEKNLVESRRAQKAIFRKIFGDK